METAYVVFGVVKPAPGDTKVRADVIEVLAVGPCDALQRAARIAPSRPGVSRLYFAVEAAVLDALADMAR